jgi:hypothetical protein
MGKIVGWTLGILVLLGIIGAGDKRNHHTVSIAYLPPGQCMSEAKLNEATRDLVRRTDWSQVRDAYNIAPGTRYFMAQMTVLDEMARIGTPPCPDIATLVATLSKPR